MDSLLLALRVVFPLFILMSLGYILNHTKLCDSHSLGVMNKLIFKVFLPASLFCNVYKTNLAESFNGRLIAYSVLAVVSLLILFFIFVPLIENDRKKIGVMIQGMFRSNFVIFGLPVTISLLGEANTGMTAMLIAVVVPLFNVSAVFVLEFFRGGKLSKDKLALIAKGILTNPLIIASMLALILLLLKVELPSLIFTSVNDIGKIATPLSLIVLGGTFRFSKLTHNIKQLAYVIAVKLFVVPALCIGVAAALGFKGAAVVALISMFGSPTAVSSYTMAEQMDGDAELAGQIVVCTTAASVISIFILVFVLKQFALF